VSGSAVIDAQDGAPGFFGKVPVLGDFVSRRLPQDFIQPWDLWLQSAISRSREQLGQEWLEVYLTSPIWRFALSAGIAGPDAWAGVMMPSVDRVGRYFPFTIAHRLSKGVNLFMLPRTEQTWFVSAETLALSALDEDTPTLDMLDTGAVALGSACVGDSMAAISNSGHGLGWWFSSPTEFGYNNALDRYLPRLADKLLGAFSLWWSTGSECVETGIALSKGLPDVQGYAAMLAGNWQLFGWEDLSIDLPQSAEHE
jgi:type VI secretion system protein ImpM